MSTDQERLRRAADDLDLVAKAVDSARAADEHLTEMVRLVLERQPRLVSVPQVAKLLNISTRGLYKRLGR